MGMYTELVVKFNVRDDIPDDVFNMINYLFGNRSGGVPDIPVHDFFKTQRWEFIGTCGSFYHHPEALSQVYAPVWSPRDLYVFSRSDLKNYGNEIDLFVDWITPYVRAEPGDCIGWKWYEENQVPELILIK